MTPEQQAALDKARGRAPGGASDSVPAGASDDVVAGGGSSPSGAPADPPDDKPGFFKQIARGASRGFLSDIPKVDESDYVKGSGDESGLETAAYYTGKIAPFFTPMGEEALAAKGFEALVSHPTAISSLVKGLGQSGARKAMTWLVDHADAIKGGGATLLRGARGGVMADPEHPVTGALSGAAGAGAAGGASALMSPAARAGVQGAASAAPLVGAAAMGGGHGWPLFWALHHLSPSLARLAGTALNPSSVGGAVAGARQYYDEGQ